IYDVPPSCPGLDLADVGGASQLGDRVAQRGVEVALHLRAHRQVQAAAKHREDETEGRDIPGREPQPEDSEWLNDLRSAARRDHVPNRYPAPRSVWMSFCSWPSSIFRRSRRTSTSSTLVKGSWFSSHTCAVMAARSTTRSRCSTKNSSSANSFAVRAISWPARRALWEIGRASC